MIDYFRAVLANPNNALGEIPQGPEAPGWVDYDNALLAKQKNQPWSSNLYSDARYQWALEATQWHFHTSSIASSPGINNSALDGKITQLVGHATHNDTEIVANAGIHATPTRLFIEDQPDIQGLGITPQWVEALFGLKNNFGNTHSITLIADSLAVMTLLERLGLPTETTADLENAYYLLGGASNQQGTGFIGTDGEAEGDSLEKIVESLHSLLLKNPTGPNSEKRQLTFDRIGNGFGNLTNRNEFYAAIDEINTKLDESPAAYQLRNCVKIKYPIMDECDMNERCGARTVFGRSKRNTVYSHH
jgi:hypothetical protein